MTNPLHDVPVVTRPPRQGEGRAGADHMQSPLRIEHVAQTEQIDLVGAAAVV